MVSMKSDMVRTDHIVQYSEQQLRKSAPSVLYTSAYRRVFMMPKAMLLLIPVHEQKRWRRSGAGRR